jgi:molybdopterin/thiamine biosynthesis adenylyltransferase
MYSRNYLYLDSKQQQCLSELRVLVAGCGLGANVAECALRLGINNFILIDGDVVELSNLNRQLYTQQDIGEYKVNALTKRLQSINPDVNILAHTVFLSEENLSDYVCDCDVVINTIDFNSNAPFLLDTFCVQQGILSLHPYNLGWAGCVFVVSKLSENLSWIANSYHNFELKIASYFIEQQELRGCDCSYLREMIAKYTNLIGNQSPPQLSVASYYVAGICVDLLTKIALKEEIKYFPELYFVKA